MHTNDVYTDFIMIWEIIKLLHSIKISATDMQMGFNYVNNA